MLVKLIGLQQLEVLFPTVVENCGAALRCHFERLLPRLTKSAFDSTRQMAAVGVQNIRQQVSMELKPT